MREYPAGKGVSVSLALANGTRSRGHRTVIAGCGPDDRALYTQALLPAVAEFLPGPARTRRHVTILDTVSSSTTHIQVPGVATDWPADLLQVVHTHLMVAVGGLPKGAIVCLSGSLPPSFPPHSYRDLVSALQVAGSRCIVDTSGAALLAAIEAKPFAIKPNWPELVQLLGGAPQDTLRSQSTVSCFNCPTSVGCNTGRLCFALSRVQ